MTRDQQERIGTGWLALLVLPALCCLSHAALVAAGVGSLTALVGGATVSTLLVVVFGGLLLVAATAVLIGRRQR